jgi:hypothetical protein
VWLRIVVMSPEDAGHGWFGDQQPQQFVGLIRLNLP